MDSKVRKAIAALLVRLVHFSPMCLAGYLTKRIYEAPGV
jgi:hypothetical protein